VLLVRRADNIGPRPLDLLRKKTDTYSSRGGIAVLLGLLFVAPVVQPPAPFGEEPPILGGGHYGSRGKAMPRQKTVTEAYLGICKLTVSIPCIKWCKALIFWYPCGIKWCEIKIPYFCQKTRTVTKWCYDFQSIGRHCYVFVQRNYGCEHGKEYDWTTACFGWFDAYIPGPASECFDEPLESTGSCRETYSIPPGGEYPPSG
jgi:hypothetical protein